MKGARGKERREGTEAMGRRLPTTLLNPTLEFRVAGFAVGGDSRSEERGEGEVLHNAESVLDEGGLDLLGFRVELLASVFHELFQRRYHNCYF